MGRYFGVYCEQQDDMIIINNRYNSDIKDCIQEDKAKTRISSDSSSLWREYKKKTDCAKSV